MTLSVSEHDRVVRYFAMQMLAQGYEVRARVDGWFIEPEVILGYRPDIVASKNNQYVIVEVKKGDVDWPKIRALEEFAEMRPGMRFQLVTPEEVRAKLPAL